MIHARYQMPVYKEILSLISNRITTADIKKKIRTAAHTETD